MLVYLLLAALAVTVVVLLVRGFARSDRGDETDRFSRARELTREWSQGEPPSDQPPDTAG